MARAKPSADEIRAFMAGFERGGYSPEFSSEAETLRQWLNAQAKAGSEVSLRSAKTMIDDARSKD
jgi:hypothetical protein